MITMNDDDDDDDGGGGGGDGDVTAVMMMVQDSGHGRGSPGCTGGRGTLQRGQLLAQGNVTQGAVQPDLSPLRCTSAPLSHCSASYRLLQNTKTQSLARAGLHHHFIANNISKHRTCQ